MKSTTSLDKGHQPHKRTNQKELLLLSTRTPETFPPWWCHMWNWCSDLLGFSFTLLKGLSPPSGSTENNYAIKCGNSVALPYRSPGAGMALWVGEAANPRWLPETGKALLTEDEVSCSIPTGLRFISFILRKSTHNQLGKILPQWFHLSYGRTWNDGGKEMRADQLLLHFYAYSSLRWRVLFFLLIRKLGFRVINSMSQSRNRI